MAQEVVSKSEHKPNADDNDCTTAITCSVCGDIDEKPIAKLEKEHIFALEK